jgi:tetratricopeptide (TPR) repeat protein
MGLVRNIEGYKKQSAGIEQARSTLQRMEDDVRKDPANFQAAFDLAGAYLQMQQTDRAVQVLDGVLNSPQVNGSALRGVLQAYTSFGNHPGLQRTVEKIETLERANPTNVDPYTVLATAQAYATLKDVPKLEATLEKLIKVMPDSPEAWYDLAALKTGLGKSAEALSALRQALDLSAKRLQRDPKAHDLLVNAKTEERFSPLRQLPEFQKLLASQHKLED